MGPQQPGRQDRGVPSPDREAALDPLTAPAYDRAALTPSVVHLGVGGFHRAHLATYIDELCWSGNTDWSIVGAGVMPGDIAMADALGTQDHLYTLITRGPHQTTTQVIGSIVNYIHAHPDPTELIAAIAAPTTQIVSMTITEGGYPIDDDTAEFAPHSPNAAPGSAFGILVEGLAARHAAGGAPLTILSCDNIISNGTAARTSTLGVARSHGTDGAALAEWIASNASFPNSMVDRITPATTPADREWLAAEKSVVDAWPVVAEPFRQWVVEDHFAGARPPLETLDILVTSDVEPYELMKLRLLNAGHSCLAYLAAVLGVTHVHDAMANDHIRRYVDAFLRREAAPALPEIEGVDLDEYIESLVTRFSNPRIADQISRLCLDGTAKFPKFLLPTITTNLAAGRPVDLAALALAGWCQYLAGTDENGATIEPSNDPRLAEALDYAARATTDPAAFLAFEAVFGPELGANEEFRSTFATALTAVQDTGVLSAIDAAIAAPEGSTP